jgi:hypothetical protein
MLKCPKSAVALKYINSLINSLILYTVSVLHGSLYKRGMVLWFVTVEWTVHNDPGARSN